MATPKTTDYDITVKPKLQWNGSVRNDVGAMLINDNEVEEGATPQSEIISFFAGNQFHVSYAYPYIHYLLET